MSPTRPRWPVPPTLFPECGPWTTAALLHGFDDDRPLPSEDLTAELDVLRSQKLAPLALHLLRQRRPEWAPVGIDALRRDIVARVARSRSVQLVGRAVTSRLAEAGIATVVTKGAGLTAHYRWPAVRTSTDVDVVVAPEHFRAAFDLLAADGWGELARSLQPWPGFHRWCREAANLVAVSGDCVDLHHRPSPWLWSDHLGFEALAVRAEVTDGVRLACGADNLAIAALQLVADHAAPGTKLMAWRDVAELGARLDPRRTAERLTATRTGGLVRWLARQLPAAMQPSDLIAALPDVPPERPVRLTAMLLMARGHHPMASHAVRLPAANAVAFLLGSAVPSREFRTRRDRRLVNATTTDWPDTTPPGEDRHRG